MCDLKTILKKYNYQFINLYMNKDNPKYKILYIIFMRHLIGCCKCKGLNKITFSNYLNVF